MPEKPVSWGGNEHLRCYMFDPDFLKSPQVNFTGMNKGSMLAVSCSTAVIREME